MFDWIADGFNKIIAKINEALQWVADLVTKVFTAAWDFIKDGVCWVFESVCDIAISAIGSVDLSGISSAFGAWSSLPAGMTEILVASGVGPALAVVAAALAVRLVLQLIPFVRLGS